MRVSLLSDCQSVCLYPSLTVGCVRRPLDPLTKDVLAGEQRLVTEWRGDMTFAACLRVMFDSYSLAVQVRSLFLFWYLSVFS